MTSAARDENRVPALIAESNVGDRAPVVLYADPITHRLLVHATGGSSSGATGLLPFEFDDIQFSNADVNGNYQTAVVKNDALTVATLTLSYDGSSKLTGVTRV
jgi:hypothetical protein